MSNISYVSNLSDNLKTQKFGVSKFNSLNVSKDNFLSDRSKMSGLHEFKCTNNRSVFGGNITIPKSDNWTSQLNSNLKSSLAMGAFSLGAVGLSEAESIVSMNSTAGISRGYCAVPVAVIAVLSGLGIACNNTYDLFSKIINNPFTDVEKNEILMDDNGVIMDYDAVFGRASLPQSSICGITKYLLRIGVLDSTGIDSRANYYGDTRYNIIGNSYSGTNLNYLTRKGYSLGVVSGEIEINCRYSGSYTTTFTYTPSCSGELFLDVYGDYVGSDNLVISFFSDSTLSGSQSVRPIIDSTEIYYHNVSTYIAPSDFNELTMVVNGVTISLLDKINQCQINGVDAYNTVTDNTSFNSTNVMCLKSGGTVLCELPNPWHVTQPLNDINALRCNLWSVTSSGVYAIAVRFLNVTSERDTVAVYMYSLSDFDYTDNDTIRHASWSDGVYYATTTYGHMNDELAPIISYAMPTLEYDCEENGIPNPYQPYTLADVLDCLTNGTEQSVEIASGDTGMQTGQFLNGTRVFVDDTDTSSSIWTKITAVSPNRVIPDEFSTLIPSVGSIANESGLSVSLPTEMTANSIASVGTTANTDATDYTATGIGTAVGANAIANAIGANITGVGVTTKSKGWAGALSNAIDKAMSLDYEVADVEEPTELELTDMGITPTNTTPSGGANTMYSVYKLSETELGDFASWLWSSDILTQLSKAWSNPMGNIIALQKVYVTLPTGTSSTIKVGGVESNVSCMKLNSRYLTVNFGSVNVEEYFGNMLDYNPYTDIQIYLPFIGVQRLDNSDVMRSIISLKYTVDIFTGDLLAEISCYRDLVAITSYQFTGNCAVAYPYSSGSMLTRNLGVVSGAGMLIGAGLGIASAGALTAGALASGIGGLGAIATSKADISHSSDLSGSIGVMGGKKPYLIITRPQQISNDLQNKFVANANNIVDKISNHSGLIKVTEPQIKISGMKSEIEMIRNELERGILV